MKVLIDIAHPAHFHFFKNIIRWLREHDHEALITVKDKDVLIELLDKSGLDYMVLCSHKKGWIRKFFGMLELNWKLLRLAKAFNPDVMLGINHESIAQVSSLLSKTSLVFTDTESVKLDKYLTFIFAFQILTPECFTRNLGKKQIRYNGYHELAYLHPNYFTPDPSALDLLGVVKGEKYVIMRFISWSATHDIGHSGLSLEMKRKAVREFSKYAKVFITSETPLPKDLDRFRIMISPEMMHDALYYASMLYGESATMASECAVMGTPSIYLDNIGRGYTDEQEEKYGAVFNFTESLENQQRSIEKGIEILEDDNSKIKWMEKSRKIIEDKIDVTKFITESLKRLVK